ncbi:hypothetical protein AAG570_001814 [Ranatra chinensis]|uniref:Proteasome subunit beta n=1 Tax=Ranatra chinensis TaxID=642074 RepID=A0ABD0YAG0_9HEMI
MSDHVVMGVVGAPGDTVQFAEYIAKNIQLYKMRNGYHLSPSSAAHYTRHNLAEYLRSPNAYNVNLLMAGYDKEAGGELFYMDYLASMHKVKYGTHGYGGLLILGIFDQHYRPDMTVEEAYEVVKMAVAEVHKRLIINLPVFSVQVITADGVKELKHITVDSNAISK